MARIEVFRTYPAPKTSWRRWEIKLDGHVVALIGGAGCKVITAEPGRHDLSVKHGGHESQRLSIEVANGRTTMVLVGMGVSGTDGLGAKECFVVDDLPRGAVPIHAPGGDTQTFAQGRRKAIAALSFVVGVDLLLWVIGAVAVANGLSGHEPFRIVIGVVVFAVATWFAFKIWPGVRLISHQGSWPLEDWRVDSKGAESEEWKRWAS
jgi:hypothetical protein